MTALHDTKDREAHMIDQAPVPGLYWHIHHDTLVESSANIAERITYIKTHKASKEVELRLALLKPVHGRLPMEVRKALRKWQSLQKAAVLANETLQATGHEIDQAFRGREHTKGQVNALYARYDKEREQEGAARGKANIAADELYYVMRDHYTELEAKHRAECPDCPWDGQTIFTRYDAEKGRYV